MLINEYRYFSQNVHVTINGASLATSGIGYQFGLANFVGADPMPVHPVVSNSISGLGNSFSVTVPAYTMIDLLIPMVTNTPAQKSGKGPPNSK